SAVRVRVHDRLLNEVGVALRGEAARVDEPLVLDRPADGGPPVAVYLVPFLEPSVDAPVLAGSPDGCADADADADHGAPRRTSHDGAMRLATARTRAHLATIGPARSVVVAHAFVAGGRVSDSERDLSIGGADRVAEATFDGFDLVALGHLHHPQEVAGARLAYSGSPLPYSFSEEGREKSVRIVELGADGSVAAEVVALGVGRPVRTLTGTLEELLTHPDHEEAIGARVRARLTDPHLPDQAMAKVRRRFPYALELRHEPPGLATASAAPARRMAELEAASPLDLALRFWADQQGAEATPAEAALLERAVAATVLGTRP
ncbi:MAG: exonuclease SbcCD subunit D C-terminal domain-containing protein, partial [Actinobacteria bacterium]|nr:exonuclease SbcCD subunit D C-terminal domain-containing protein [Actinomycetota bacterium]